MNYQIHGRKLKISADAQAESQVEFRWPVAEVIQLDSIFVVRIEPDIGSCDNCNVCAVDVTGNTVWTVADRKYVYADSPFTKVLAEEGKLKLFNWDGLTIEVDPNTWKEVSAVYGR